MNISKVRYYCRQLDNLEEFRRILKGENVVLTSDRGTMNMDRVFADIIHLIAKDISEEYENHINKEMKGE